MKLHMAGLMVVVLMVAGCVSQPQSTAERADPFEKFNRVIFDFNYGVMDRYVVRPVAIVWRDYIPQPARNSLGNFTSNLEEPAMMVNYLLQGNIYDSAIHLTRFFLNSTLGLAGFIDVAGMASPKLEHQLPRRFGSTLAHYGADYGPYLQVPFYGSFTLRDDGASAVDYLYPVMSYFTWPVSVGKWLLSGIEARASLLDADSLLRQSSDPYIFTRDAYFQYHDFITNGGRITPRENPNSREIEGNLQEIDTP